MTNESTPLIKKLTRLARKLSQLALVCPKCGRKYDRKAMIGFHSLTGEAWFKCENCGVVSVKPKEGFSEC